MRTFSSLLVTIFLLLIRVGCVRETKVYCESPPCPPIKEKVSIATFLVDALGLIITLQFDELLEEYKWKNQFQ